jgi:hypothetical protein
VSRRHITHQAVPDVSARTIRRLMAQHRVTIREIAACYNLTQKQVRHARYNGGPFDWPDIIRGTAAIKENRTC